ncbi:MAG: ABC transporter permease [Hyphomicrobiales bacterium]|nr:MAG: ABC transporter permease [Hyphomicrobiales bacterium]
MLLRLVPVVAVGILVGPVIAGLAGIVFPAFGYLPALGANGFSLDPWRAVFATPGIGTSILLSLATGLITTAVSLGAVLLFVAGWQGTRLFRVLTHLLSPLLSLPHAAAAFGLAFLIAPSGWIVRALSPWATGFTAPPDWLILNDPLGLSMMAGLVIKEIPFLFLVTLAALPQTDARRLTQVTTSFGYGRIAGWTIAVLPRLYRQIRLPILAVIAYASSVIDVALILGPTLPPPLSVQLVRWMNDPELTMRLTASAGALLQLGVTLAALALWRFGEIGVVRLARARLIDGYRRPHDGLLRGLGASGMAIVVGSVALGLAGLALWSVASFWRFPDALPVSISFRIWASEAPMLADVIGPTVLIGLAATGVALALVLGALENENRQRITTGSRSLLLLYIPLIVPQIAFLFGLKILFLWIGLDATLGAVVFVHLIFVMPYVFLSLADPWRAFDRRYGVAAAGLGAGENRVFWRIRLPMLAAAVATAAAVGFAVSIGQYLPTLIVGAGRWPTVTTEAVALAAGGDRRVIGVYALIQVVLPFVAFALATIGPALAFRNRRGLRIGA